MTNTLPLIGVKLGMTRIFDEDGTSIPVTVIGVDDNRIMCLKTKSKDGYDAVQVTTGTVYSQRVNRASAGQFIAVDVEAGRGLWEFRVPPELMEGLSIGNSYSVEVFSGTAYVDVKGVTKGKGFQGGVKRHNFRMQDATHGNSLSHRSNGSIGQNQTPGRVFKGKKMSGQMGNVKQTTQNLKLIRVDAEKSCLLVRGAVPGAVGASVQINSALKK